MTTPARRSDRSPRAGSQAGFLLAEVLVVLGISALIFVGLAAVLALMVRTADNAARTAQAVEREGRVIAALERDLRLASRVRWSGAPPRAFVFAGKPDSMVFAQDIRGEDGLARPLVIALTSVTSASGGTMLRAEGMLGQDAARVGDVVLGPARTIYDGALAVRFAYFGASEPGGDTGEFDTWPSRTTMPSSVRISLVDPGSEAVRRSIMVPLMVGAEPGCASPGIGWCSLVPDDSANSSSPPEPEPPQ